MTEIVRKLTAGAFAPPEHLGDPLEPGSRDIQILVQAETQGGMKKRAVVRGGREDISTWEMWCDEGTRLGGEDSAPPPLAYFSAAIAF